MTKRVYENSKIKKKTKNLERVKVKDKEENTIAGQTNFNTNP